MFFSNNFRNLKLLKTITIFVISVESEDFHSVSGVISVSSSVQRPKSSLFVNMFRGSI